MPRESFWPAALRAALTAVAFIVLASTALPAAAEEESEADPLANLAWRNIGPYNMSGRVSAVAGVPGEPTVYVGAASGGVWKSEDEGTTFRPIFDDQPIASIGDVALAPSNPEVIYVGTGEGNPRNSVSFGDGVYRSSDGGASWRHVGLRETQTIARVEVHPSDPDTVLVAAIGPIYGPSVARGVFRTTDGGATWDKVLYLDQDHGAADLDIDPENPEVVFATMWRFRRKPWTFTSGGDEGGVWRSLDGGVTWKKLENGLPKTMGRVAVKVAPSNPETVYVLAESNDGILFRSDDRGETFRRINDDVDLVSRGFYYTDLRVDPSDENRVFAIASRLFRSIDGGKSFERIARSVHIDFHSLWIDPEDPRRIWIGEDGGVAVSHDGGGTWRVPRNLPLAQFYQVFHGYEEPFYTVGGGLQDNGTWYGPIRTREPAGILEDDWRMMSFGDAYWVVPHPTEPGVFISESQAGGIVRTDMKTRVQVDISPQPRRNDGAPVEELEYRFNWNSPIIASPHDPLTVYFAGNVVFESTDFGDTWQAISPDLTTDDPEKQGTAGGPVWPENTTAEYHTTIISFAESPVEAGVLWAGSDDGNLQLSRDGGETWSNLIGRVAGVPAHSPVSHIEPSRTAAGTAYVSFDRHALDDFRPHVYRTADFGASWQRIVDGLPDPGWVWVVREDPNNPDLLYAGTELGLWASWDRGGSWRELDLENLPTVAVHDVLVHPRDNDLIVGTHGRAIWVFDDATPIQRAGDAAGKPAHLFPVRPALRFPSLFTRYGLGDHVAKAPNPPPGALITYALAESLEPAEEQDADEGADEGDDEEVADEGSDDAAGEDDEESEQPERIALEILDAGGEVVRTLRDLPKKQGLNRVAWNLAYDPPLQRAEPSGFLAEFFGPPSGPAVLPGTYTARLTVDGEVYETPIEVRLDPSLDPAPGALESQLAMARALSAREDAANRALRALDRLKEQIAARRETRAKMREADSDGGKGRDPAAKVFDEMTAAVAEQLVVWTREEGKPFWSQGPKLADRVDGLGFSIDSQFGRPTAPQRAYFDQLVAEVDEALVAVNVFLDQTVPGFNERLAEHGVPPVAVPERVTVPGAPVAEE